MHIPTVSSILKVLKLLGQMPIVGEGSTRPTIVYYSGIPQSTVYRYLDKLEELKLVTVSWSENRNCQNVGYWKITDLGKGYILDKELL